MNDRVRERLQDALFGASTIHSWVPQHSRKVIETSILVESAYIRQFGIISEALRVAREKDELLEQHFPRIHEWVSLRHHLIHDYREVDRDLLWQYATDEIPDLIFQLKNILG